MPLIETVPPARNRSIEARRAARAAKAGRERLIVECLNRGLSMAETAARIGVTEKRIRAIVPGILARRMPAAPEDFVAVQISRLNEALLVAYGAMSGKNLRAVGLVVRIVRELDRYHGFVPAAHRPARPAPEAEVTEGQPPAIPAEAFASPTAPAPAAHAQNPPAHPCEEPGHEAINRPRSAPQASENAQSAPGTGMTQAASHVEVVADPRPDAGPSASAQKPSQAIEDARLAPGNGRDPAPSDRPLAALAGQTVSDPPEVDGLETTPQAIENARSAPGNGAWPAFPDEAAPPASAEPAQPPARVEVPMPDNQPQAPPASFADSMPPYPGAFRPRPCRAILNGVMAG